MGMLRGAAPIRRTIQYLQNGQLVFKDRVKIMEVHYNMFWMWSQKPKYGDIHVGLREFYFWDVPQIQYKNPNVQIVRFVEQAPVPFIRCWLDNGKDVLFDCDSKDRQSIVAQLTKTLGKTRERIELEEMLKKQGAIGDEKQDSPAIFGFNRERFCGCEVEGQVPCPAVCPLPKRMQGKYLIQKREELEAWENDLEQPEMTQKELQKLNRWWPVEPDPQITRLPGLERMYMKKQKQRTIDYKPAEKLVKDFEVQKKLDEYLKDKMIKYVQDN